MVGKELIDMRWCLYLKSNQNNLAWNELMHEHMTHASNPMQ